MKYSFEKLDVWEKSKDFAVKIYRITKAFPKEEKFESNEGDKSSKLKAQRAYA